jgi:hypothetical protein
MLGRRYRQLIELSAYTALAGFVPAMIAAAMTERASRATALKHNTPLAPMAG